MVKQPNDAILSFVTRYADYEEYAPKIFHKTRAITRTMSWTDICVDGKSVLELFGIPSEASMTTVANSRFAIDNTEELCRQLGGDFSTPELPTSITPFYICKECGDYGCGVFGWKISLNKDTVVWHSFSYDDSLEHSDDENDEYDDEDKEWLSRKIIFNKKQYFDAIEELRARCESVSLASSVNERYT